MHAATEVRPELQTWSLVKCKADAGPCEVTASSLNWPLRLLLGQMPVQMPRVCGFWWKYSMHCRSLPLLRGAAEGLEGLLQLQRFHAETQIMILGQLEALLWKCCQLQYAGSPDCLQSGRADRRSEVCH